MKRVVVVGSGASAVHFSLSALGRGWRVTLLDVGRAAPAPVRPEDTFLGLKDGLDDASAYFLGERFEAALLPGAAGEYYGFPPHKEHVFAGLDRFPLRPEGFDPLVSFAQGGLAEAWTGGCFPFNDAELEEFPLRFADLAPFYGEVARRIGISGARDDLERFVPAHEHLAEPLDLDAHSARLLEAYDRRRGELNDELGCWVGRSRTAVLREDGGGRRGCTYLGRCLWGCPREALYTPLVTLRELRAMDGFEYVPRMFVSHLECNGGGAVRRAVAMDVGGGPARTFEAERVVLAAGTLATARIVLESLRRRGGSAPALGGLMDNRQVLVPFVNLSMLREGWKAESYQYHQVALGLSMPRPREYVHGLVTTLKTALIHPIVQSLPLDLRSALWIFRNSHAALGIVNVNLHDERRPGNVVSLEPDPEGGPARLLVRYAPPVEEPARLRSVLARVRRALWKLGCIVPPGLAHVRPMGASVHYAGTLPMTREARPLTVDPACRSRDFENLWIADGSTFPFLPAKNVTFTLMANAVRIADRAF